MSWDNNDRIVIRPSANITRNSKGIKEITHTRPVKKGSESSESQKLIKVNLFRL